MDLTASPRAARHRYHFGSRQTGRVVVDLSVGGILSDRNMGSHPEALYVAIDDQSQVTGWILVEGVRIYFCMRLLSTGRAVLWQGERTVNTSSLDMPVLDPQRTPAAWRVLAGHQRNGRIGHRF